MISFLFYNMIAYQLPNNLLPVMINNFHQIPTLNNISLFIHIDIPPLIM